MTMYPDDNETFTVSLSQTCSIDLTYTGSGSVACSPNSCLYPSTCDCGTSITISATPASGWTFAGWTGDYTGTTSPATFTLTGNMNVSASFTTQYTGGWDPTRYTYDSRGVTTGQGENGINLVYTVISTNPRVYQTSWYFYTIRFLCGSNLVVTGGPAPGDTVTLQARYNKDNMFNFWSCEGGFNPWYTEDGINFDRQKCVVTWTTDPQDSSYCNVTPSGGDIGSAPITYFANSYDGNESTAATLGPATNVDVKWTWSGTHYLEKIKVAVENFQATGSYISKVQKIKSDGSLFTLWTGQWQPANYSTSGYQYLNVDNPNYSSDAYGFVLTFTTLGTVSLKEIHAWRNSAVHTFQWTQPNGYCQLSNFFPWDYYMNQAFTEQFIGLPFTNVHTDIMSPHNRQTRLVELTNFSIDESQKKHIGIVCRTHPSESCSSLVVEGLMNYIKDHQGDYLDKFHWYIVPVIEVDATLGEGMSGCGQSCNYHWGDNTVPVINAIRAIMDTANYGAGMDCVFDMHSQGGSCGWSGILYISGHQLSQAVANAIHAQQSRYSPDPSLGTGNSSIWGYSYNHYHVNEGHCRGLATEVGQAQKSQTKDYINTDGGAFANALKNVFYP